MMDLTVNEEQQQETLERRYDNNSLFVWRVAGDFVNRGRFFFFFDDGARARNFYDSIEAGDVVDGNVYLNGALLSKSFDEGDVNQ